MTLQGNCRGRRHEEAGGREIKTELKNYATQQLTGKQYINSLNIYMKIAL